jgi:dienelactone hydrolase
MIWGLAFLAVSMLPSQTIEMKDGLAISGILQGGRIAIARDPVCSMIARGILVSPKKGEEIQLSAERKATWTPVKADAEGNLPEEAFRGGYFYTSVELGKDQVMLLEAVGHGLVYVNGAPHAGDPYGYGYLRVPVELRAGVNRFLFASGRGPIKATLKPIDGPMLDADDATLPDLGEDYKRHWGSVTVINPTRKPLAGFTIETEIEGCGFITESHSAVPPLSTRKVAFQISEIGKVNTENVKCRVRLVPAGADKPISAIDLTLRIRKPNQTRKVTFISDIDGSVQYYAVNPSQKPSKSNALILSTHGASVEAIGQADAYASKDWATLVAPTNRRPYGFDWEDWGRLDALEVLKIAKKEYAHDPQHVVLTGHSMGGHGTWHLGVTYPDLFAAIGPSAGWSSFFSYGGSRRITEMDGISKILARAMSGSDTLKLLPNTLQEKVYILHGDADDNVPVSEERLMRDALIALKHPNLQIHEQPGAGHWWGIEQGPGYGSACVDWKPMMDLFKSVKIPLDKDVKEINFTTANPGVSGRDHWLIIEQQIHPIEISNVQIHREGAGLVGATKNVAALNLDLKPIGGLPSKVVLDGQSIVMPKLGGKWGNQLTLINTKGKWSVGSLAPGAKSSQRTGTFKMAFNKRMVFLYATKGTDRENEWAFAKARYDAEQWQYRGNGAVDVLPDTTDLAKLKGRNLILYGNRTTNAAWAKALKGCPIDVSRGQIATGAKTLKGDNLGVIFVYPRSGSKDNLVGVYAGTGLVGMRTVERLSVYSAGTAMPDWMVVGVDALDKGIAGIRGAGYFGNDWKVESGDSAWSPTISLDR